MRLRPLLAGCLVLLGLWGTGCNSQKETVRPDKLIVGVVSYGEGAVSLDKYERFKDYLAEQTNSVVELEPAFNELQAVEQIQRKNWSLVFAPPGLAAIAMGKELYIPLFSMEGVSSTQRSLIVVKDDSPAQGLNDLSNKIIALGEAGSAAGYYLPLYDLYGLTLSEIRFASTPKTTLQWISEGQVDAGALSEQDYERYRREFSPTKFRILHTSRWIPAGVVLLGPTVDRNQQEEIERVMSEAPSDLTSDAGYIPTAKLPNYNQFIKLVEKVKPIEDRVRQTPAVLTIDKPAAEATDEPPNS